VDFWVAVEANRARHEKEEGKRAKQEERTRLASVLSACAWDKKTTDPDLLRAARGFWIGTETQNAGLDRAWGKQRRCRAEEGALSIYFILFTCTYNHIHPRK
jgi:hypothetical protein